MNNFASTVRMSDGAFNAATNYPLRDFNNAHIGDEQIVSNRE